MKSTKRKFESEKFVTKASQCDVEIYEKSQTSQENSFAEFNIKWHVNSYITFHKSASFGPDFFIFTIRLKSDEMPQSKKYQYRVSGRIGSIKVFESDFKTLERKEFNVPQNNSRSNDMLDLLTSNGSYILTFKLEIRFPAQLEIAHQYANLLDDDTFSDFTFVVKGQNFKVHKSILAGVSETMRAMFTTRLNESVLWECTVDDIEPDTFRHMLKFVYAGIIPANLDAVSIKLYKAAHYYRLVNLMEICRENILPRLAVDTAPEIFELSTLCDMEDVKIDAWNIVKSQILQTSYSLTTNEPLPLKDFHEILDIKRREQKFWSKHKK